ncbi:SDR family NAD(P)-dependent oxidoreductase [Liquorilactobacillus mali]|uniref:D-alanine transfer protein, short-chain dehydrogenase n=1 Tax=Liquorilactobacillus mali KCTC 3596 = DSM 20444 TaxID=1046596 RepID=J0UU77_9LACO|nr:SDR family NAD(P)-dependent oxidoreductase [Liquorilactobacillus mali]EJF01268.1 D-alanine transfer protein, short-chain dehydrogenase [Liquorilactobacillus mali KCTC 3596 = DSM 20444]KRN08598.1 D-alanine transfer protein, short-chain dehydrogenase [Liquorilactobacillus mali KCTC 3596 = DSM 20444]MDC7952794.1 SDR family NAD(P)-dependent oxidoreductase [Liquorilactobacillus mali]QFQ75420.1 SDR family NAD(P)-dependent oxidoreductase [Liquorilactobacillus mali]
MKMKNKKIVIIGGTSGIGLALAKRLAIMGNQVIVGSRSKEKISEVIKNNKSMSGYPIDVSDQGSVQRFYNQVIEESKNIDVVINSAGIMKHYNLLDEKITSQKLQAEIQTNLIGTITVDKIFLPVLRKQAESLIVNVSSGLANLSSAAHPIYSATKAGVHMFTDALREQLHFAGEDHVHVMELVPPLVAETNLEKNIGSVNAPNNMKLSDLIDEGIQGIEEDSIRVNAGLAEVMREMGQTDPDKYERELAATMIPGYFPNGLK